MRFSDDNERRDKAGIAQWLSAVNPKHTPPDTTDSFVNASRRSDQDGQRHRVNGGGMCASSAGTREESRRSGASVNGKQRGRRGHSAGRYGLLSLPPSCRPVPEKEKNSRRHPSMAADQPFCLNTSPNPAKSYDRKSRHKTRKTRYDPKINSSSPRRLASSTKRANTSRAQLKAKRKRLDTDFRATNVREGRLTLDPGFELGLFHHGKTSSPFRRTGSELPQSPLLAIAELIIPFAVVPDLSFSEMKFLSRDSKHELETAPNQETADASVSDSTQPIQMSSYFGDQQVNMSPSQDGQPKLPDSRLLLDTRERGCSGKTQGKGLHPMWLGGCPIQWYNVANDRDVESRVESSNRSTCCYTWSRSNSEPHSKRTVNVRQQSCGRLSPPIPVPDHGLHNSLPTSKARIPTASDDLEYSLETDSRVKRMVFRNAYIPRSAQIEGAHSNRLYSFEDLVELARSALYPAHNRKEIQCSQNGGTSKFPRGRREVSQTMDERPNEATCDEAGGLCALSNGVESSWNFTSPAQGYPIDERRHSTRKHSVGGPRRPLAQDLELHCYRHLRKRGEAPSDSSVHADVSTSSNGYRFYPESLRPQDRSDSHCGGIDDATDIALQRYTPRLHLGSSVYSRAVTPLAVPPACGDKLLSITPYREQFGLEEMPVPRPVPINIAPKASNFSVSNLPPSQFWRPNKLY